MTVAGLARPHGSVQLVAAHPSGGAVRGRRGPDGTIEELSADGDVLVIGHRDDAQRITDLLGVSSLRGWAVDQGMRPDLAIREGLATECCADPAALDGGYPASCPTTTRRDIGAMLARLGDSWGISRADLRAVRAAVIHAGYTADWDTKPSEMLAAAEATFPALRALRRQRRAGLTARRASAAHARREPTAVDLLRGLSAAATPGEALRWQVAQGPDRAQAAALLGRSSESFARGAVVLVRRNAAGKVTAAVADPQSPTPGPVGNLAGAVAGERAGFAAGDFVRRFEQARRAADARRSGDYCFGCRRPSDGCTCVRGDAFAAELAAIGRLSRTDDRFDEAEHRWGDRYARRVTDADRDAARRRAADTRAAFASVLGAPAAAELEEAAGSAVFENLALFEVQTGHRVDELSPDAVDALRGELLAAESRAESVHASADVLRELDVAFPPGTVELYMGRDGRYYYETRLAMQAAGVGAEDREIVYLSGSRGYRRASEGGQVSQFAGRPAVMIDTGFVGSVPRDYHQHFGVGEDPSLDRKSSLMRLMCVAVDRRRGFASQLSDEDATVVEHDAHPARSSRTIGLGDDRGAPTSAFEQMVSRQLTDAVRRNTREWAASPPPVTDRERAAAFFTPRQLDSFDAAGIPPSFVADAGRDGLEAAGVFERWEAPDAPPARKGRLSQMFAGLLSQASA